MKSLAQHHRHSPDSDLNVGNLDFHTVTGPQTVFRLYADQRLTGLQCFDIAFIIYGCYRRIAGSIGDLTCFLRISDLQVLTVAAAF